MPHRVWAPVLLAALVVFAGLPAPTQSAPRETVTAAPDPETDAIGWENGYWYNDTLDVDQSDGLTDRELEAIVARTMARVEHVRQLEFEEQVPVDVISREEFRGQRNDSGVTPAIRAFDNAKFEALFLVNETTDSVAVQEENAGTAVLGYYSSGRKAIVLISDSQESLQISESVLAHELMHALQDQHFNLSRFDARTRDERNAESGLIEGDASYTEHLYTQRCDGPWNGTCLEPDGQDSGRGDLAHVGLYFIVFHPYSDGPAFVAHVHREGGWSAVNAMYDDPPASSEQIIHPEKYPDDRPTRIRLPDRTGEGWERVRPESRPDYGEAGEAAVMVMFVYPLYHSGGQATIVSPQDWLNRTEDGGLSDFSPLNYSSPYSAGWDGDRLHVYQNGDGETAYVWRLAWDSTEDAREFYDGYRQVLQYWGAERVGPNTYRIEESGFDAAIHVVVRQRTVTIVNAPTVEQLTDVRRGITVETATPATGNGTTVARERPPPATTPGQSGLGLVSAAVVLLVTARLRR